MTSSSLSSLAKSAFQNKLELWKKRAKAIPVLVTSGDEGERPGVVYLERWDQKQRMKRALKTLGLTWGLAVGAVLIPLMHFILVPSLLIAGPALAYYQYQQQSAILGGTTECPKCGVTFEIVKSRERWPLKDVCSKCFTNVVIRMNDG